MGTGAGQQGQVAGLVGLATHARPLTSEGHNFFIRTLFRVFLGSMESPLSSNSIHVLVEGSGYWRWLARAGRVGWPGRAGYSCETSNFERS